MELGRRPRCCYTCLMYCQQGWLDNRQIGYLGISVESTGWCYNDYVFKTHERISGKSTLHI